MADVPVEQAETTPSTSTGPPASTAPSASTALPAGNTLSNNSFNANGQPSRPSLLKWFHLPDNPGLRTVIILTPKGLDDARNPEEVQRNNRGSIHSLFLADPQGPDIFSGLPKDAPNLKRLKKCELWCRDGQDVWDNKNIFTHRTLTNLKIRNIMLNRTFRRIKRLEFPKELKQSTNLTALVLDGIHIAALPAVFRLPRSLETLELIVMEPKGESNPWAVVTDPPFDPLGADQNIMTDALGPLQHTLKSLLFMHDNFPSFLWGQHFSRLQTLVVSSENLFPPGPKHWTDLELFDMIPRSLENLKIENCDFKLELNGDINEKVEIPGVDYNKVVFIGRSLQRLMTQLRFDFGHGLKDLTICIPWAAHSGLEKIQFGELPTVQESLPSLEKIQNRFARLIESLFKRRGTEVHITTRGHFENDVGKY